MLHIVIKTTHLSLDDPLYQYIYEKIGGLDKFIKNINPNYVIQTDVEIAKNTKHHQKGYDLWRAEVNMELPGRLLRSVAEDWDLRVAINRVKDELQIELKKYKTAQEAKYKRGARILKNLIRLSPLALFKRKKGQREWHE